MNKQDSAADELNSSVDLAMSMPLAKFEMFSDPRPLPPNQSPFRPQTVQRAWSSFKNTFVR